MLYDMNDVNPYILRCSMLTSPQTLEPIKPFPKRLVKWYEAVLILGGKGHILNDEIMTPAHGGTLFFRKPGTTTQGFPPFLSYLVIFDLIYDVQSKDDYLEPDMLRCERSNMKVSKCGMILLYKSLLSTYFYTIVF